MSFFSVITTIQKPTISVINLLKSLHKENGTLVIIGDSKGPFSYEIDGVHFYDIVSQAKLPFSLSSKLPIAHYARKNIGYLLAIKAGATCIYETDDDNEPLVGWHKRDEYVFDTITVPSGFCVGNQRGNWINIYKFFTEHNIWPRGFPLDEILNTSEYGKRVYDSIQEYDSTGGQCENIRSPIQQGLVNNSPDVDAIWRMVFAKSFNFDSKLSVYLAPGNWCPFNTQTTWWWPVAFPLLYIPSYCSFRMCDIWKSFVAQRCIWELGLGVTFHSPEVVQNRNTHNLMNDFADEIDGYIKNKIIVNTLESVQLDSRPHAVGKNLFRCYEALVEKEIFPSNELELVTSWLDDIM